MGGIRNEVGYLEDDYLTEDYLGGQIEWFEGFQVQMVVDDDFSAGTQVEMFVGDDEATGFQVEQIASLEEETGFQAQMVIDDEDSSGFQVQMIVDDDGDVVGWEIKSDKNLFTECGGYLEEDYLTTAYLGRRYCGFFGFQAQMVIDDEDSSGFQVQMIVDDDDVNGFQAQMVVDDDILIGFQVEQNLQTILGFQVNQALYNATKMRVLCDFDSRGTTGANWTATSQEPGDFSVLNLNNDIEEFFWRSAEGDITSVDLVCDTEISQGVLVDTIAVRNHNLTTSGTIVVQGSNDPSFSSIGFEETLVQRTPHSYYIAPVLPENLFRYWRFRLNDATNPDNFLKIGTIIFGQSRILFRDCQTDEIQKVRRHFSDKIETEGFTNVNNNRSLKDAVRLNFRNMEFSSGDYQTLQDIFEFARTNLKCLWVPDPRSTQIERFTVFAKMRSMPQEQHNNKGIGLDHISFSVDLDESL